MAKAKDFQIGTKFFHKYSDEVWTLVAYSVQGDQVVIVENSRGDVKNESINDLLDSSRLDSNDRSHSHKFTDEELMFIVDGLSLLLSSYRNIRNAGDMEDEISTIEYLYEELEKELPNHLRIEID